MSKKTHKYVFCIVFFIIAAVFAYQSRIAVSIVMPVYNTEIFLDQSIQSILSQTMRNFEFIIVDDGSTDKSLEKIRSYAAKDDRIKVYTLSKNSGAAAARNEGMKHIRGKYTLFVDSDDWLDKRLLEKTYKHAVEFDLDMVMFQPVVYQHITKIEIRGRNADLHAGFQHKMLEEKGLKVFSYKDFPDDFLIFSKKYPWNKLIRTDLIKKYDLYFDAVPKHNDSFFITMAMIYAERIGYIKDHLYFYRVLREGNTVMNGKESEMYSVWRTFQKIKNELRLSGIYPVLRNSLNYWIDESMEAFQNSEESNLIKKHFYIEKLKELKQ